MAEPARRAVLVQGPTGGSSIRLDGRLLSSNAALSLAGQLLPLMVAVVTMPTAISGLGSEAFGVVSLAWALLNYFAVFDLGVGRAATKLVAEHLGKGDITDIPDLVWTSAVFQACFGALGSILLLALTPVIVSRCLRIPGSLVPDARLAFSLLALSAPVVLISSTLYGMLEAFQRFDLSVCVRSPSTALNYLVPFMGGLLGWRLPVVFTAMLVLRLVALAALVLMSARLLEPVRMPRVRVELLRRLFRFGAWVTASAAAGFLLGYTDRFVLGSLISVSAVTFYTVPYEMISRLWVIPSSLGMVLFPAFSYLQGQRSGRTPEVLESALRMMLLMMAPLVAVLVVFAGDVLRLWLGAGFAQESAGVLRILSLSALVGGWGPILGGLIQGVGRPDMLSKLYALELVPYAVILWLLTKTSGAEGAAIAATLRTVIETGIVLALVAKLMPGSGRPPLRPEAYRSAAIIGAMVTAMLVARWVGSSLILEATLSCVVLVGFVCLAWLFALTGAERRRLVSVANRLRPDWLGLR